MNKPAPIHSSLIRRIAQTHPFNLIKINRRSQSVFFLTLNPRTFPLKTHRPRVKLKQSPDVWSAFSACPEVSSRRLIKSVPSAGRSGIFQKLICSVLEILEHSRGLQCCSHAHPALLGHWTLRALPEKKKSQVSGLKNVHSTAPRCSQEKAARSAGSAAPSWDPP